MKRPEIARWKPTLADVELMPQDWTDSYQDHWNWGFNEAVKDVRFGNRPTDRYALNTMADEAFAEGYAAGRKIALRAWRKEMQIKGSHRGDRAVNPLANYGKIH